MEIFANIPFSFSSFTNKTEGITARADAKRELKINLCGEK